jgi:hypothetical protein
VITSAPAGSVVTANLAKPFISVAEPSVVEPTVNVTDPVANVVADLTIAVNVTDSPTAAGFTDEKIWVAVAAAFTLWFTVADVLVDDALSPLYAAVIGYTPAPSVRVVSVAAPCELSEAVPKGAVPFLKVMVPVATGPAEVTVAVKVTACP